MAEHVIDFLIAQRRAKKKTFTRFQIVEALTPFQKRKPKLQNQAYYALKLVFELVLNRDFGKIDAIRSTKAGSTQSLYHVSQRSRSRHRANPSPLSINRKTTYGCGMRISECLRLRVKDIEDGTASVELPLAIGKNTPTRISPPLIPNSDLTTASRRTPSDTFSQRI